MRNQLFVFLFALVIVSCSKTGDEGFLGEWVGETIIIVSGNPTSSETSALITNEGGTLRECSVFSDGQTYVFDATEQGDVLYYDNAEVKNVSDSLMLTYITGEATLIGDTLLVFDHEVVTMNGSTVLSSIEYSLEFKREE